MKPTPSPAVQRVKVFWRRIRCNAGDSRLLRNDAPVIHAGTTPPRGWAERLRPHPPKYFLRSRVPSFAYAPRSEDAVPSVNEASGGRGLRSVGQYPRIAAAIAIAVGAMVFTGWAVGIEALKSLLPGLAQMKAITATALALTGLSLWFSVGTPSRWRARLG